MRGRRAPIVGLEQAAAEPSLPERQGHGQGDRNAKGGWKEAQRRLGVVGVREQVHYRHRATAGQTGPGAARCALPGGGLSGPSRAVAPRP
jgi:hypothetical protein